MSMSNPENIETDMLATPAQSSDTKSIMRLPINSHLCPRFNHTTAFNERAVTIVVHDDADGIDSEG